MTTSCSAGFFGDCTHPEIVGSAGRNMSTKPAPVKSFQNVEVFKKEENSFEEDPRDYPEPFIQHYDPALELDYEYYDDRDLSPGVEDAQPSASNIVPASNRVRQESDWDTGVQSALSAFASLVNIPLDRPSNSKDRIDRIDSEDNVEYVNNIDRAFPARPPQRRRVIGRENFDHTFKLPGFKKGPKKIGGINDLSGHRQNLIPVSPPPLYPVPPTEYFNSHQDDINNGITSEQFQNIIPHKSEDSDTPYETSVHQTTPDTFRPSSLLTDDPDEFQPVTKSDSDAKEHKRPYRQTNHSPNHGSFSSSFQSFSPAPGPFGPTRFPPSRDHFDGPPPSQRGPDSTHGFLPAPNIPSSGNFIFNQPPIHPAVFNSPFRPVLPQSGPPLFNQPRPLTHPSSMGFSHSPPEHHTHIRHHPAQPTHSPLPPPPPRSHGFAPSSDEHIVRPQNDRGFVRGSTFIHTPNQNPVTPPPTRTFIHHTTPTSVHTFSNPPFPNTFASDVLNRPTPTPGFIATTPQTSFGPRPQNPFGIQHDRPLIESFPNIVQESTESPQDGFPILFPEEPPQQNIPLSLTSTTRPVGSPLLNTPVQKNPQTILTSNRPQFQSSRPPTFNPLPSRRRRPVATQKPVSFTTAGPVAFTTNRPTAFPRRPPSRAIRKNNANRLKATHPTLVTGLEHSQFNSQFLQPDGRHPGVGIRETELEDSYTTFDDSQLREPESHDSLGDFVDHVSHPVRTATTEKSLKAIEDSNNIASQGEDYEDVIEPTTRRPTTIITTTQKSPVTLRGPLLRRRPNVRNRVRTRPNSLTRTTTPEPNHSEENKVADDEKLPSVSEPDDSSTITTLSPFRQRVRDRLNRFKQQQQDTDVKKIASTEATPTETSSDDDSIPGRVATTPSTQTGNRPLNSDRFQRYRNRLRNRLKNRLTRTTASPNVTEEDGDEKQPESSSSLRTNVKSRRINPLKSRRNEENQSKDLGVESKASDAQQDEELADSEAPQATIAAAEEVLETEESTGVIQDELDEDQQVEETSHTLVQEYVPSLDQPLYDDDISDGNQNEEYVTEIFQEDPPTNENTKSDPTEAVQEENDTTAPLFDDVEENAEPESNQKRKRIINPNFRARFQEFIKNRRNRVSASYTTATPDITDKPADEPAEEKSDSVASTTEAPNETSTLSLKERMKQFNKNRDSIRQRFLANRQSKNGERLGRRIPLRPLRNKVTDEIKKNNEDSQTSDNLESDGHSPEAREIEDDRAPNTQSSKRNPVIVPLNKVTDGFTPALSPIHVKSPLMEHLAIEDATRPVKEPEIITAAPTSRTDDTVLSIKVSATLGGDSEVTSDNEEGASSISSTSPEQLDDKQTEKLSDKTLDVQEESKIVDTESSSGHEGEPLSSEPTSSINFPSEFDSNQHSVLPDSDNHEESVSVLEEKHSDLEGSIPLGSVEGSSDSNHHSTSDHTESESTSELEEAVLPGSAEGPKSPNDDQDSGSHNSQIPESDVQPREGDGELIKDTDSETEIKSDEFHPASAESPLTIVVNRGREKSDKNTDTTTDPRSSTRVSKPTFNLSRVGSKGSESKSSAISASDFSGEFAENVTPVPLLPITMSTDPPKLPLEMLLPLSSR